MASFKTVKVILSDDGTSTFEMEGYKGKECEGELDDLIKAMGDEKKNVKKPEYYKDEKVQIKQRF